MEIKRTLNRENAKYDLLGLDNKDFTTLCRAYEHYMFYIRHCPPSETDSMWQKMQKVEADMVKVY